MLQRITAELDSQLDGDGTSSKPQAILMDTMDNAAEKAYSAHPERLYVLQRSDSGWTVAYKGGMGPFGYKPEELRQWLLSRK